MVFTLVRLADSIDSSVVDWLTDGMSNPTMYIPFLLHLDALRRGAGNPDGVVVLSREGVVGPDFDLRVRGLLSLVPEEYTTCLLSHYVTTDWSGIAYVEGCNNLLATPTSRVEGSSLAYWIRGSHLTHLLELYDQPIRYIADMSITPETLCRRGRVCMACTPIVGRLDESRYIDYYANYGFVKS